MERWRCRVALVTGASVGIGTAIAVELVRLGMKVVGCARDVGKIQKLAVECQSAGHPDVLVPFKCDLTKEEKILSMFAAIKEQHKGVDVCINNAGLAHPELLLNGKTSSWKNMMDVTGVRAVMERWRGRVALVTGASVGIGAAITVELVRLGMKVVGCARDVRKIQVNVLALSICTREAYQSMKERNVDDGHVININGMCGHRVITNPDLHFYTATKYAVTALTEGLRQALRAENSHIRVTCISPGLVETEFLSRFYKHNPDKAAGAYSAYKPLEVTDVASAVTYVLSAPPHVQIGDVQMQGTEQV